MKSLIFAICLLGLAVGTVFAGGDKVRGDEGQGGVNQVQVQDPPPFQDDEETDVLSWVLGLLF